jgi:hypothetical protein
VTGIADTVALAAATFVALAYTIFTTRRDRRQAAADRLEAAQRLSDERAAGDSRLRQERDYAESLRRMERQADNAQMLARRHSEGPALDRDIRTLRNYARWVRISLVMLAEDGAVPPIAGGSPEVPLSGLAEHMPAWLPHPVPPGWTDEPDDELEPRALRPGTTGAETGQSPETAGT